MMPKPETRAYELTAQEAALVEGYRRGRLVASDENWFRLSPKEWEVIKLCRVGQFGSVLIEFCKGEPVVSRVTLDFRHGKLEERRETLQLLSDLCKVR